MKFLLPKKNLLIAIFIAILSFSILFATVKEIGMVWDEPAYNKAAESYANWTYIFLKDPGRALQKATIDTYFETNHEHPPVAKMWSGVVWFVIKNITDPLTAFRIGPMISAAILMAILYLMIAELFGNAAGIFASSALISLPRFFFHSHLATLDVPITVACFITTYLFWKTIDRKSWLWGLLCGVIWGVSVAVKLNGVFVFFSLFIWVVIFRRKWKSMLRLVVMGATALLTFFISWPWLYHNTWQRVIEYINFHVNHYRIGYWFLGKYYLPPPWYAVFVILWAVLPLTFIILAGIGGSRAKRGATDNGLTWLLIISAVIAIMPFFTGVALLYDGERLFMPIFPYLAGLAGIGFGWIMKKIGTITLFKRSQGLRVLLTIVVGLLFILPSLMGILKYYPHLLSYYSETVGGIKGATRIGLETTYWNEAYPDVFPILREQVTEGDVIWAECDTIRDYKRFGVLPSDLACEDFFTPDVDWFLLQYRQSQYSVGGEENYPPLIFLQEKTPLQVVAIDGIPILKLYHLEK